jgi:hypothetical protein
LGEFGSILVLALTPTGAERFWWTAAALALLLADHATYRAVTHPVNDAWPKETRITGASRLFFGLFAAPDADWRHMRSAWEWSHVVSRRSVSSP